MLPWRSCSCSLPYWPSSPDKTEIYYNLDAAGQGLWARNLIIWLPIFIPKRQVPWCASLNLCSHSHCLFCSGFNVQTCSKQRTSQNGSVSYPACLFKSKKRCFSSASICSRTCQGKEIFLCTLHWRETTENIMLYSSCHPSQQSQSWWHGGHCAGAW